jgi:ribose transport system substrate-binding protein
MKHFRWRRSGRNKSGSRRATLVGVAVATAALLIAGCGASDKEDSGSESSSAKTDAKGSNKTLDEILSKDVALPYPTTPTKVVRGRQMSYILLGIAAGGSAEYGAKRKEVFEAEGWKVHGPLDGKFTPSVQSGLIEQAVLEHPDAIVIESIFPSTVPEALKSAVDAGIPVICDYCSPDVMPKGVYNVGPNLTDIIKTQVPFVLAAVDKPDATIVLITDPGSFSVKAMNVEQRKLLKEQCPGCKIPEVTFPVTDLGKPAPPSFVNLLRKYPKGSVDAVMAPYTPATSALVQLAEQAGRDDFKIFNNLGAPPIPTQILKGNHSPLLFGDVVVSMPWMSYATVDALARLEQGQPVEKYILPGAPITKANAAKYVNEDGEWAPEDMEKKFHEQWGLSD